MAVDAAWPAEFKFCHRPSLAAIMLSSTVVQEARRFVTLVTMLLHLEQTSLLGAKLFDFQLLDSVEKDIIVPIAVACCKFPSPAFVPCFLNWL